MKTFLTLALTMTVSTMAFCAPAYLNTDQTSTSANISVSTIDNNTLSSSSRYMNYSSQEKKASDSIKNENTNGQSKPAPASNETKPAVQKDNSGGKYMDMQRGRRVLEHKYNLYA
ncbi:MAG: hypothetical protein ACM3PX_02510 [Omnitrophica WOR_2 bacterium]|jgi:hypothetical protein